MSKAKVTASKGKEMALARNMMIIVLTDFVCWLPIMAMGMLINN